MIISKIVVKNFRNIKSCTLNVNFKDIVLIGKNGQGKTNLLEAIYYLCYGSSFRTSNKYDLVSFKENWFYLYFEFYDEKNISHSVNITLDGSKKLIMMDDKKVQDRREIINNIPCIIFSHEDIDIVRGEVELRRKFFDQCLTLTDISYLNRLSMYKHTLRQRNAAIKLNETNLLELFSKYLIKYGREIMTERSKVCERLSEIFSDLYERITENKNHIKILYKPSWDMNLTNDEILNILKSQADTEQKFHATVSGPHRDKYIISDDLGVFNNKASTGQIRLASLLLKTAQALYFKEKTNTLPLYLIDDVLLELDTEKRSKYLKLMGSYSQAFYTFLPDEKYFNDELDKNDIIFYDVKDGNYYAR